MPGSPRIVLYVRHGCHLCDEFQVGLALDLGPRYEHVEVVDVDGDPALAIRFGLRVPVLEVAGTVVWEGRYDAAQVRRALRV